MVVTLSSQPTPSSVTLNPQSVKISSSKTITINYTPSGQVIDKWDKDSAVTVSAVLSGQPCDPCIVVGASVPGVAFDPVLSWDHRDWNTSKTTKVHLAQTRVDIVARTGYSITPSGLTFTSSNWSTAQNLSVKLVARPSAPVTLRFAQAGMTFNPSSVTFTSSNWNTAQTVAVTLGAQPTGDVRVPSVYGGWTAMSLLRRLHHVVHRYRPDLDLSLHLPGPRREQRRDRARVGRGEGALPRHGPASRPAWRRWPGGSRRR